MMFKTFALAASITLVSINAAAAPLMPDFNDIAPTSATQFAATGWYTDRYEPTTFANVGTYQGRDDVLGIGITSAGSTANRPAGFLSAFYNTQGRQHLVSGGAGSSIAADLYIPESWSSGTAGNVRTDIWGIMANTTFDPSNLYAGITSYPIFGFTNYGGVARYRVFDGDLGAWIDLLTPVEYNDWTSFKIQFTGSAFEFLLNGNLVYTDNTINGTTGFRATIMQAYNFGDAIANPGAVANDYTAYWSNTASHAVPIPGSFALLGLGLVGLLASRRKKA
jgi:hypothetical protein